MVVSAPARPARARRSCSAQRGVDCVVLDRWPESYPLPRAVHFDDEVFRDPRRPRHRGARSAMTAPGPGDAAHRRRHRVLAELNRDRHGRCTATRSEHVRPAGTGARAARPRSPSTGRSRSRGGVEVATIARSSAARAACGPGPGLRHGQLFRGREEREVLDRRGPRLRRREQHGPRRRRRRDGGLRLSSSSGSSSTRKPAAAGRATTGCSRCATSERAATFMTVTRGRYRWEFRLRADERADDFDDARVVS